MPFFWGGTPPSPVLHLDAVPLCDLHALPLLRQPLLQVLRLAVQPLDELVVRLVPAVHLAVVDRRAERAQPLLLRVAGGRPSPQGASAKAPHPKDLGGVPGSGNHIDFPPAKLHVGVRAFSGSYVIILPG